MVLNPFRQLDRSTESSLSGVVDQALLRGGDKALNKSDTDWYLDGRYIEHAINLLYNRRASTSRGHVQALAVRAKVSSTYW